MDNIKKGITNVSKEKFFLHQKDIVTSSPLEYFALAKI